MRFDQLLPGVVFEADDLYWTKEDEFRAWDAEVGREPVKPDEEVNSALYNLCFILLQFADGRCTLLGPYDEPHCGVQIADAVHRSKSIGAIATVLRAQSTKPEGLYP